MELEQELENCPVVGVLSVRSISAVEEEVIWDISRFLSESSSEEVLVKSEEFSFNNRSFWFFIYIDEDGMTVFGIQFSRDDFSDKEFVTYCDMSFQSLGDTIVKKLEFMFEDVDSNKKMNYIVFPLELWEVYKDSAAVICRTSKEKSNNFEARSETDTTSSIKSDGGKSPIQSKLSENEDEELPMVELCQDFKNLLLSEEGSDVTIQVENRLFKAHRSILMARSSVFASMFGLEMKKSASEVVKVDDCEPLSFPALLEYIYYGSTENLTVENAFSLYVSADTYDLQFLKMKCLELIQNNISVDTICETITLSLKHPEVNLLNRAIQFFAKNFKKIIVTQKWQVFVLENPSQSNDIFVKALC